MIPNKKGSSTDLWKDWRAIKKRFFLTPQPTETEAFVHKVMSRLDETAPTPLHWPGFWWKVPAMAMAAFIIMVFSPQPNGNSLSTEAILLCDRADETESEAPQTLGDLLTEEEL